MKILNLRVWIPLLLIGIFILVITPVMTPVRMYSKSTEAFAVVPSINWTSIVGQICLGLGSLATIIRGIVELLQLVGLKRRKA